MSYFRPQKTRKTARGASAALPDSTRELSQKRGRVIRSRIQLRCCLKKRGRSPSTNSYSLVFVKRDHDQPQDLPRANPYFWTVSGLIVNDDSGSLLVAAIAVIGFVSLVLITKDWRSMRDLTRIKLCYKLSEMERFVANS